MTLRQPLTQQMKDVKHTVENGSEPRDIPPMYPRTRDDHEHRIDGHTDGRRLDANPL